MTNQPHFEPVPQENKTGRSMAILTAYEAEALKELAYLCRCSAADILRNSVMSILGAENPQQAVAEAAANMERYRAVAYQSPLYPKPY